MGFLDKVKDAAGKAADQAKHATAVGKEKLEDVRLQKKINDLCQEIGALVVAQRRNVAPEDASAQIDAKDNRGQTPLHLSTSHLTKDSRAPSPNSQVLWVVSNKDVVELLLAKDHFGQSYWGAHNHLTPANLHHRERAHVIAHQLQQKHRERHHAC